MLILLTLLTLSTPGRENQQEVQKQHCPVGVGVDYLLAARKRPAGNIMMIRMIMEEENIQISCTRKGKLNDYLG